MRKPLRKRLEAPRAESPSIETCTPLTTASVDEPRPALPRPLVGVALQAQHQRQRVDPRSGRRPREAGGPSLRLGSTGLAPMCSTIPGAGSRTPTARASSFDPLLVDVRMNPGHTVRDTVASASRRFRIAGSRSQLLQGDDAVLYGEVHAPAFALASLLCFEMAGLGTGQATQPAAEVRPVTPEMPKFR